MQRTLWPQSAPLSSGTSRSRMWLTLRSSRTCPSPALEARPLRLWEPQVWLQLERCLNERCLAVLLTDRALSHIRHQDCSR